MPNQPIQAGPPPRDLCDCLAASRRITVFTGAGMSADAGIPTFRDAHTGLWAKHDPMALASPEGFARDPALVWGWYQWRRRLLAESRPHAGHRALAAMAGRYPGFSVITQNVDGFHQLAGSTDVLELHGNLSRDICSRTRQAIDAAWMKRHADRSPVPSPHHPGGLARPDVVWFGESLDADVLHAAFAAAAACDLMLVIGTSAQVQPAASLPLTAANAGARLVEINPQPALGTLAEWTLQGTAAAWLPRLADAAARVPRHMHGQKPI